ncbi:unnamed protein product [Ixodes persulcatus]
MLRLSSATFFLSLRLSLCFVHLARIEFFASMRCARRLSILSVSTSVSIILVDALASSTNSRDHASMSVISSASCSCCRSRCLRKSSQSVHVKVRLLPCILSGVGTCISMIAWSLPRSTVVLLHVTFAVPAFLTNVRSGVVSLVAELPSLVGCAGSVMSAKSSSCVSCARFLPVAVL